MRSRPAAVKYAAEAVGTFFLVFCGTGAVVVNEVMRGAVTGVGISLVFGLIVLAMIYTIGHVSGAHMNPAVTIGFWAGGRLPAREILPYAGAQLLGAGAASLALKLIFLGAATDLGLTLPAGPASQAFALELVMTALLMFVIMGVATDERAQGEMAGIAVGAVIALEALFGGPISGASMNPARSFGPALATLDFRVQWLYWAAPICGSILGALVYDALRASPAPTPDGR